MIKVYKFGLVPIKGKTDLKIIDEQFEFLNRYYNDLVEIARKKEIYEENLAKIGLDHLIQNADHKQELYEACKNEIKSQRIKSMSKKDDDPKLKSELEKLKKEANEAYKIYNSA